MDATNDLRSLLTPGQEESTETVQVILNCAVEAKLSKEQWEYLLGEVGAEKIEDVLDLYADDYERCGFKPLLQRRIEKFQSNLFDKYFNKQVGSGGEEDGAARGSCDAVAAAPLAVVPPPRANPPLFPGTQHLCRDHRPSKNRVRKVKYWFFNAVKAGCQVCVQTLVEDMGIDTNVRSDTNKYTAMEFAVHFEQPEMCPYLQSLGFT